MATQSGVLVFLAEQTAFLQNRNHLLNKITNAIGQGRWHQVKTIRAFIAPPLLNLIGNGFRL